MTEESSQAALEPEGCLARMSRWATAPWVIPLLTGLSFSASTVFAYLSSWSGFSHNLETLLPMLIVCLVLGVGLGVPLRQAVMRIRDTGRPRAGIWVVAGVGLAWMLAFPVQWFLLMAMFV